MTPKVIEKLLKQIIVIKFNPMIFGDKNNFAIEADFFQGEDYLFISYCYWVNNEKIGDNSQRSLLVSELENIKHNSNTKNERKSNELAKYNCKEIYDYLTFQLWNVGSTDIKIEKIENINNLTVIKDYGECFDGFFCYLLEFKYYDLFIWNDLESKIKCKKIEKNSFYKAFEELDDWINSNTKLILALNSKRY